MRLFVDTGPFVALHHREDHDHDSAVSSFKRLARKDTPYWNLYTSDYILDESITTCRRRSHNHKLSVQLGEDLLSSKSIILLKVDGNTIMEAWKLYKARSEDDLSFTDCTIAVQAKKHGITNLFTYDTELGALGFATLPKI